MKDNSIPLVKVDKKGDYAPKSDKPSEENIDYYNIIKDLTDA